jgi:hypothetical protein
MKNARAAKSQRAAYVPLTLQKPQRAEEVRGTPPVPATTGLPGETHTRWEPRRKGSPHSGKEPG